MSSQEKNDRKCNIWGQTQTNKRNNTIKKRHEHAQSGNNVKRGSTVNVSVMWSTQNNQNINLTYNVVKG